MRTYSKPFVASPTSQWMMLLKHSQTWLDCLLVKADIKSAFRFVPVHLAEKNLLAVQ